MKFLNQARKYGAKVSGKVVLATPFLLLGSLAHAADESGITTADILAIITDGKAKALIFALAMLGFVWSLKVVKHVRGAG